MADTKKPKRGALDELAEEDVRRAEKREDLDRIGGLRGKPSAEYVARVARVQGTSAMGPETAAGMADLRRDARPAPLSPTGRLSEYDMATRADGARAVEELDALPRMRQQVVERSGTGAPGQVYVEKDGAAVLMPLRSAEQQRLRVISADEARDLGRRPIGSRGSAEWVARQREAQGETTPQGPDYDGYQHYSASYGELPDDPDLTPALDDATLERNRRTISSATGGDMYTRLRSAISPNGRALPPRR
jgi:hypothetical protein